MPRISAFFGITIYMYFRDHAPPHFHAFYGDDEAQIEIESGRILKGKVPARAYGLIMEWLVLRRPDLRRAWEQASRPVPIEPVPPLE